jgi:exodeoxyribonuclease V gamma subunit
MLNKYVSNQIETLAELFADHIGGVGDVFVEDVVVVQSLGMSRWLNLRLADVAKEHIVANVDYLLPRNYIFKVLRALKLLPDVDYMSREYARWNIYSILPEFENNNIICEYMKEPGADLKRWQLSSKIAELFDHYMMYRYQSGDGLENLWKIDSSNAKWQKLMFNQVKGDEITVVEVLNNFVAKDFENELKNILPKSLSLFSISNMPPIFLRFFYELSLVVDVNLFYLSPAEGFWGDIVEKRKVYARDIELEQYWENTNDFLALNCRLGQEFFLLLQDFEGEANDVTEERFSPIDKPATLLHSLQNDLLRMDETIFESDEACDSIVFASCHSEIRELQVLYDYLLRILNDNTELQPTDILVMMPQIEKYAPYINAVFGHPEMKHLKIPFCLSDSNRAASNDIATYLIKILDLAKGRVTADDVMDLLENEDIARKFYLFDSNKEFLRQIVLDTNLAWGINRDFIQELCDVSFANNNWQDCIDRWLTGYAISQDSPVLGDEILPYDIEGSTESIMLGRFVAFLQDVFETITFFRTCGDLSPSEWSNKLQILLDDFFAKNFEKADYRNQVIKAISNINIETAQVGFELDISLSVVRDILYNSVNSETTYAGFLQKGVTFCKLLPMRSVPAKVICLLGVNDGVFPRSDSFIDFDLMKSGRQVGERSARYEDRYLFLETILAVRERLYISYLGQHVVTNETKPPSIVVSELMDVLKKKLRDKVTLCIEVHRIQPFNKQYFVNSDLNISFSKKNLGIAKSNQVSEKNIGLLGLTELGEPNMDLTEVIQVSSFSDFFKNPIKEFLKVSFNISYRENEIEEFLENEPLEIEPGLDAWQLKKQTFEILQKNSESDNSFEVVHGILNKEGSLPVGENGVQEFEKKIFRDIDKLYRQFSSLTNGYSREELFVDIAQCSIQGNIMVYRKDDDYRYVSYSFSKHKPTSDILFRLEHLLVSAMFNCSGTMIFQDKSMELDMIDKDIALEKLQRLSEIYLHGLKVPLVFYPKISYTIYKQIKDGATDQKVYDSIRGKWTSDTYMGYKSLDDKMFFKYFGESAPLLGADLFELMKNNSDEICKLVLD